MLQLVKEPRETSLVYWDTLPPSPGFSVYCEAVDDVSTTWVCAPHVGVFEGVNHWMKDLSLFLCVCVSDYLFETQMNRASWRIHLLVHSPTGHSSQG